jgi:hypothetical protein
LNVTKELQMIFAQQKYEKTLHKNLHANSLWTMLEAYYRYYLTSTTLGFTDYSSMHKDGAAIWKRGTGRSHWREVCRVAVKHGLHNRNVVCVGFSPFFLQINEISVIMKLFGAGQNHMLALTRN